jgi:hypothetical protein
MSSIPSAPGFDQPARFDMACGLSFGKLST